MKSIKELVGLGYEELLSISVGSSDRGMEELLENMGVTSLDQITLESEKVKDLQERLIANEIKHDRDSFKQDGEWILFSDSNGIGWSFISLGYFIFNKKSEVTTCSVRYPDGTESKLYLKEVSDKQLEDFKYFFADGREFDGEVLYSDTNVYFAVRRQSKKESSK